MDQNKHRRGLMGGKSRFLLKTEDPRKYESSQRDRGEKLKRIMWERFIWYNSAQGTQSKTENEIHIHVELFE